MLDKTRDGLIGDITPHIATLPQSGIIEVVNHGRQRDGIIQLWVGEGDQPTPRFICDAAMKGLHAGETFYTWQRGIPPLREALGDYLSALHNVHVDRERVFVTVGGMQAIMNTVQMLFGHGDEAVIPTPVWPNVFHAVQVCGAKSVQVPLTLEDGRWSLDLDRFFAACGPRTRFLFINSLGNPTGWVMPREDMIQVRDFAREHGLWIVADEVYTRFYYDRDTAPSFLEIMDPNERLIVVSTFSKNWAMSGWRIGWLVAPVELGQVYESLIQYNTSGVPGFLQRGAVTAIRDGEPFVAETIARSRAGRDLVCRRLREFPRLRFAEPDGAFYLFFAVDGEPDARRLALRLIDDCGVGMAPGTAFGPGGEEYLRLCFATSEKLLNEAIDRLTPHFR
ncbi:MAG: pyridoxal phosphate-dependent aminotransferase [Alphaproteobacteria bacterium]|nr:pyridoxal phosphate-dependent aminotransferase [Alphaproteobacteria bacterium]